MGAAVHKLWRLPTALSAALRSSSRCALCAVPSSSLSCAVRQPTGGGGIVEAQRTEDAKSVLPYYSTLYSLLYLCTMFFTIHWYDLRYN